MMSGSMGRRGRTLWQIRQDMDAHLADWRGLLGRRVAPSRQIPEKLWVIQIVFP
jgi:hypothetical protein